MSVRHDARPACRFCRRTYSRKSVSALFVIVGCRSKMLKSSQGCLEKAHRPVPVQRRRAYTRGYRREARKTQALMFTGELTVLREVIRSCPVDTNDESVGQCSREKLFCDGLSPCGSCSGKGKRHTCLRDLDHHDNDRRVPCELSPFPGDVFLIAKAECTIRSYDAT